jgi:hypothetical protein
MRPLGWTCTADLPLSGPQPYSAAGDQCMASVYLLIENLFRPSAGPISIFLLPLSAALLKRLHHLPILPLFLQPNPVECLIPAPPPFNLSVMNLPLFLNPHSPLFSPAPPPRFFYSSPPPPLPPRCHHRRSHAPAQRAIGRRSFFQGSLRLWGRYSATPVLVTED